MTKAWIGFRHVGLGPPVDENVARHAARPARPVLGYTQSGELTHRECDLAVWTAPAHQGAGWPSSPWAPGEHDVSVDEGTLDTVWVFGFDEEPNVGELVGQVESLLGDEELEGTVEHAGFIITYSQVGGRWPNSISKAERKTSLCKSHVYVNFNISFILIILKFIVC